PRIAPLSLEKLAPAHARHQIVEQNQLGRLNFSEYLQGVPPVARHVHLKAVPREELAQQRAYLRVIVNQQDRFRHEEQNNMAMRRSVSLRCSRLIRPLVVACADSFIERS